MKNGETRVKIFSAIVATFPLISSYVSPISGIDLGTFVLIVFIICSLNFNWNFSSCMPLYLYVAFITPMMLLSCSEFDSDILTILFRYAKFILLLGGVFGFGFFKNYYNEKIVFDVIKKIIYVSSFFVLLQRIFYLVGIVIKNPFLKYAVNDAYIVDYNVTENFLFRPAAFFLEPAHLALYAVVFLIYSLFKEDSLKKSLITTFAILASGSGMGLVLCAVLYCIYFSLHLRKIQKKIIVFLPLAIIAVMCMSRMSFFTKVVSRFTTQNLNGGGNAIIARIGNGYQIYFEKEWIYQLLGNGYGNVPVGIYLNGATYILNTLGIVGALVFIRMLLKYFAQGELWQKIGIFILFGLTLLSQTFTPANLIFYLCIYKKMGVNIGN